MGALVRHRAALALARLRDPESLLSDVSRLSGYERGEFVEVRGALGNPAEDDLGYAPEFEIHQIERLGN